MGYLNPIEVMGYQAFADQASAAGVDGALVVDVPRRRVPIWSGPCAPRAWIWSI